MKKNYLEISREERKKGKKGLNKGIPINLPRLAKTIPNIQKKYYTIASDSGVGKSKFTNYLFMYNSFFQWKSGKIEDYEIVYLTAEMTIEEIIGEFQAILLYLKYNTLIDIDTIYSYGDKKISDDVDNLLESEEVIKLTEEFISKITIISENFTPKFVYKSLFDLARRNGEIVTKTINNEEVFAEYKKTNPNKWCIFILDNFQKLKSNNGDSLKDAIIQTSSMLDVYGRIRFGFVCVGLQQLNRVSKTFDRYKLAQYFPSEQDLKDSEAPFHDCQVCIVQISPFKLDLDEFAKYKIKGNIGLKDRFRAIKIIKNRGGNSYVVDFLLFLGENAFYKELPYAEDMKDSDYEQIKNLI